jgi:RHS repeat-associated protein
VAEYIYLDGQPVAEVVGTAITYIHTDHQGTPMAMTDGHGAKVWAITAKPFGDGATISGPATLNLRFPGQYVDQETGLNQNWFREYDPRTGRYVRPDPIGFLGGLNFYGYVASNPVRFSDPFGLAQASPAPSPTPAPPPNNSPSGTDWIRRLREWYDRARQIRERLRRTLMHENSNGYRLSAIGYRLFHVSSATS